MDKRSESHRALPIRRITSAGVERCDDPVCVEEPMEIRVGFGAPKDRTARSLSVTMRTPGDDFELAVGFLFTEGILTDPNQVGEIAFCGPILPGRTTSNIVRVELDPAVELDFKRLERHFFTTSSCGICGKASLDALHVQGIAQLDPARLRIPRSGILRLPDALRRAQPTFARTGGLHAAALAASNGALGPVREDVGRHNAVDKLIGRCFLDGETPLADRVMVVSGRSSFEILQKALVAGVPMIVAVGAPSSLAVELAERFGMTLVGFAGSERFNVYSGAQRIVED